MVDDGADVEGLLAAAVAELDQLDATEDNGGDGAGAGSGPADGAPERPDLPGEGEDQGGDPANHEAARWRVKLRESEADRSVLDARLEASQRSLAEHYAARFLTDPSDLWAAGTRVESMMNLDGDIDAGLVKLACQQIRERHPHWGVPATSPDRDQGMKGGAPPPTWGDMFGAHPK
jgi:hypothetical protein